MASFLGSALPAGAAAALLMIACGTAFTSARPDGGAGKAGADASHDTGGSAGSGGNDGSGGADSSGGASGDGNGAGGRAAGGRAAGGADGMGGRHPSNAGGATPAIGAGGQNDGGNEPLNAGGASGGSDAGNESPVPPDGLILWLRADRGVTSKNGTITRWADQSLSRTDATQSIVSLQPVLVPDGINGHPAVLFDGVDDFLQIAQALHIVTGEFSIFTIVEATAPDQCSAIFEASNGSEIDDISIGPYQNTLNFEIYQSANEDVPFQDGVPLLFDGVQTTSGDGIIRRNAAFGTAFNYPTAAAVDRMAVFVGKTLYADCGTFAGHIGEIIVYDRALSVKETQGVEKYLTTKFGCCDSA